MIKLVAVDMDGTFLRDDKTYDEDRFAKIYQRLTKNNIQFVVASGNQYFQLCSFFEKYPDVLYVAENGALIRSQEKIISLHQYPLSSVKKIESFLNNLSEIQFLVCGAENAYELRRLGQDYFDFSSHYYYHLKKIDDFSEINDRILKFAITCPDDKTDYYVQLFKEKLSGIAEVTSSGHGDIDIVQPGIHKANGLKELGATIGVTLDEMVAFGDGGNDLEMIQEVGDGVAMKNATPALLKVADHITTSNKEDGVLSYLENLLDKQEKS
ncbi:Cof-type HAD-IIB family hydrolase [Lactobacillus kalixensis]|uniref:Sugar phosphatase SupH n=1 Tax=Lactobacillus kalixensis DSM 16043 TaxID=1423763 RepID=A0A0R1UF85_9LACO|nr:Cof-type HAD-IIB family hydrolase [Lactobacillus kalixensis]KRL91540.1 sugar phosphatase SupH [Lactobacillus kalixensis DSM 16043]